MRNEGIATGPERGELRDELVKRATTTEQWIAIAVKLGLNPIRIERHAKPYLTAHSVITEAWKQGRYTATTIREAVDAVCPK